MSWQARALVFSGRLDPTWDLPTEVREALVGVWSQLGPADDDGARPSGLGYRGIEITTDDGRTWLVANGVATLIAESERTSRRDPDHRIEHLVLASAPPGTLPPGTGPSEA